MKRFITLSMLTFALAPPVVAGCAADSTAEGEAEDTPVMTAKSAVQSASYIPGQRYSADGVCGNRGSFDGITWHHVTYFTMIYTYAGGGQFNIDKVWFKVQNGGTNAREGGNKVRMDVSFPNHGTTPIFQDNDVVRNRVNATRDYSHAGELADWQATLFANNGASYMDLSTTYNRTWDFDGNTSCRIYFDWKGRLVGGGLTESSFSNDINVNCPGFQAQYCGPGAEVGL